MTAYHVLIAGRRVVTCERLEVAEQVALRLARTDRLSRMVVVKDGEGTTRYAAQAFDHPGQLPRTEECSED